ncbi:MAG TPA: hypothetical protein DCR20_05545 [Planctomycetaceae bacterium]|jgi:hypothetical protein|nr:hypothetical protein [Planctomycetaceae bacterium]
MVDRRRNSEGSENDQPGGSAQKAGGQQRAERLAAIRRAVEAGEYDSEELLAIAFDRMLKRYQSGLTAD